MFIALKPITVGSKSALDEDGHEVMVPDIRNAGDAVPEAADWMHVQAYLSRGELAYVPDTVFSLVAKVDQLEAEVMQLKQAAHQHNKTQKG